MKIFGKAWIVAGICGVLGAVFLCVGIAMGGGFKYEDIIVRLGYTAYEKEYTVIETFDSMEIDVSCGKLEIVEGEEFAIEYTVYGEDLSVENQNGVLKISGKGENKKIFGIVTTTSKIKIYIPAEGLASMENVKINVDMGDVDIAHMQAENFEVDVDMGDIDAYVDVNKSLLINVDMGDVDVTGRLACDITIDADMGDVDVVTSISKSNYKTNIDTDLGSTDENNEGGEVLENTTFNLDVNCDMGNVDITYK